MTGYKEIKEELRNSKEVCTKIKQQLANTDEYLNYMIKQKYKMELIEARKPNGFYCKLIFRILKICFKFLLVILSVTFLF